MQRRQAQAAGEPRRTPENNLPSSPFPHSLLPKAREPPEQLFGGFGFFVLLSDICAEDGGHLGAGRTAVRREVAAVAADHKAARIRPLHRSLRPGRDLTGVAVAGKVCARRHIRAGQAARTAHARVAAALAAVDMAGYENRATHTLSGGQKQRVALAGVLALSPDILVFDEATAMLDPDGRQEVLRTIHHLHKELHKTVVMITHYIEEAIGADRVYLIHNGKMIADGTAREMLTQPELLAAAGLTPPMPVRMYHDLKQAGIVLARCPLTLEELAEELCRSQ